MEEKPAEKHLPVQETPTDDRLSLSETPKEKSTSARDRAFLRRMLEVIVIGLIIPSTYFGYPEKTFNSVTEWLDVGKAQLDVNKAQYELDLFWGDDLISNLFQNISTLIISNFILYVWNPLMENQLLRYIVALLLAGMIYDLVKKVVMSLYSAKAD